MLFFFPLLSLVFNNPFLSFFFFQTYFFLSLSPLVFGITKALSLVFFFCFFFFKRLLLASFFRSTVPLCRIPFLFLSPLFFCRCIPLSLFFNSLVCFFLVVFLFLSLSLSLFIYLSVSPLSSSNTHITHFIHTIVIISIKYSGGRRSSLTDTKEQTSLFFLSFSPLAFPLSSTFSDQ